MGTFIRDGATQLPTAKTDLRPASIPPAQDEWAAADANQIRTALLDLRTAITGGTIAAIPGIVSVAAYGAVGDGVTDDTSAIQSCVTDNPGGTIYFPPASVAYLISDAITVPPNTSLVGMGWGSKIIRSGGDSGFLLVTEGCLVRDLWLAHVGGTAPTAGSAIYYVHPATLVPPWNGGTRVEHVKITDCFYGIYIIGYTPPSPTAVQFTATACIISDIHEAGIYINNCADAHFSDFWIDGGSSTFRGSGIWLDNWCQGVTFQGMEVLCCDYALRCTGVTSPIAYNKFSNCYFDTCATGAVYLDYCTALEFDNCWTAGTTSPTGYGYSLNRCSGVNIRGGNVFAVPNGILIPVNSNQISLLGVIFMGDITTAVDVAADTSYFKIQSCTFGAPGVGGTITNGVVIAAGTSDRYILADNIFYNTTFPVADGGTGLNKRVADNY